MGRSFKAKYDIGDFLWYVPENSDLGEVKVMYIGAVGQIQIECTQAKYLYGERQKKCGENKFSEEILVKYMTSVTGVVSGSVFYENEVHNSEKKAEARCKIINKMKKALKKSNV